MPPDTKKIIQEIPDLIHHESFNESASDKSNNKLNSSTQPKLSFK